MTTRAAISKKLSCNEKKSSPELYPSVSTIEDIHKANADNPNVQAYGSKENSNTSTSTENSIEKPRSTLSTHKCKRNRKGKREKVVSGIHGAERQRWKMIWKAWIDEDVDDITRYLKELPCDEINRYWDRSLVDIHSQSLYYYGASLGTFDRKGMRTLDPYTKTFYDLSLHYKKTHDITKKIREHGGIPAAQLQQRKRHKVSSIHPAAQACR